MNLQNKVAIVTHQWADGDGLIAIVKLKRYGESKIPGISEADIYYDSGDIGQLLEATKHYQTIVFVDKTPEGEFEVIARTTQVKIVVFDHHPHDKFPGQTATSIVSEYLGLTNKVDQELDGWAKRFDFQTGGDPMDLRFLVKEMHHIYTDQEVIEWFAGLINTCYETGSTKPYSSQVGREIFVETMQEYFDKYPKDLAAKDIFQKWLERAMGGKPIEDQMHVINAAGKILEWSGKENANAWLIKIFHAVNEGQRTFLKAREDLEKAEVSVLGNIVLVSATTGNPRFGRFVRSQQGRETLPRSVQEKLGRFNPIVLQICPERKGFQIFGNGLKLGDVVGALRAELLKARGKPIPSHWTVLKQGGTTSNTDPLYYQTGDFEVVMWGSLTRSDVPPVDLSEETIKRAVTIALDRNYFPPDCDNCKTVSCPLREWQLTKCSYRRKT